MADAEKKPTTLSAFIAQTAKVLRDAADSSLKKKREFTKENGLSSGNKIGQIASLLRSQAKKRRPRKKKKR